MTWWIALSQHGRSIGLMLLAVFGAGTSLVRAQEPLSELPTRIDKLLESSQPGPFAGIISDEEFARRIFLDLTGAVPSAAEAKAFLSDASPNKRANLVERLLGTPQYIRHMATTFDVMLMERRPEKNVKRDEWHKYLYDSFAQNKPWNQLVREILAADGTDEKIRPAAKFYLDREGEPNALTRDVGRMFFGMDLACCQCHDHPLITAYEQSDYYGIYAFLSRSSLFTDKDKKVFFAEKAEGDVKFTSVFTKSQDETRPRLPGDFELDEPAFLKGDEYITAPAEGVRSVPKFSRRAKLAELATSGTNRAFNRNIVNRLWALMMGRGLVEPIDMQHLDNPASHPELLDLLADEFAKMNFDIKAMLRALAGTNAYQRSVRLPDNFSQPAVDAAQQLTSLGAKTEESAQSLAATIELRDKARVDYDAARKLVTVVLAEFGKANEAVGAAQKAMQDAAKALAEAQQQLAAKKDIATTVEDAANKSAEASAKLPQEKELAQAAEKFKTRAAQLAVEVTAAEKLVADRTPGANAATEALATAKTSATAILDKLAAAKKQLADLQRPLGDLSAKIQVDQTAAQESRVRLDAARSLHEIGAILAAATSSRAKLAELESKVTGDKQMLVTLTAQLPESDAAITVTRFIQDDMAKRLAEVQSQLSDKQQAAALLAETTTKAELVTQKLPQDADLKLSADALKVRRDQLNAEAAAIQNAIVASEQSVKTAAEQFAAAMQQATNLRTQLESLQKSLPLLESQIPEAKNKIDSDDTASRLALENANQAWTRRFLMAPLEPLSPEQIAWSILKVTGVVDQYRVAVEAEINKTMPVDPKATPDPKQAAEREKLIEQNVFDKLKGNVATFVGLFGHAAGQPQRDFFATVDQPLFFANGGVLQSWLNPSGENLVGRAIKLTEPKAVADELYFSILTRRPTDDEVAAIAKYLESRVSDRPIAIQEIAWALITSIEFRFR